MIIMHFCVNNFTGVSFFTKSRRCTPIGMKTINFKVATYRTINSSKYLNTIKGYFGIQ